MGIGRDEGGWVFVGRKRVSGGLMNLEMGMESNLWKCNDSCVGSFSSGVGHRRRVKVWVDKWCEDDLLFICSISLCTIVIQKRHE